MSDVGCADTDAGYRMNKVLSACVVFSLPFAFASACFCFGLFIVLLSLQFHET